MLRHPWEVEIALWGQPPSAVQVLVEERRFSAASPGLSRDFSPSREVSLFLHFRHATNLAHQRLFSALRVHN